MAKTVRDIRAYKARGERFPMLTAYDTPTARLVDAAGVPVILVGDSVGNNVLGYRETVPVTMDEMVHHAAAVMRGVTDAFVVGDMPFMSYQASLEDGMRNAGRFMKEAGVHSVKVEGGSAHVVDLVARLVDSGVPVMGHLGLTPQSVHALGGYRVQARSEEGAQTLLQSAKDLEAAGCFAIVLEAVPAAVAQEVTTSLSVPTIGIGAGPHCDGQVLVLHDMLGLNEWTPRFVKRYADIASDITKAVKTYADEVASGRFPAPEHSYE